MSGKSNVGSRSLGLQTESTQFVSLLCTTDDQLEHRRLLVSVRTKQTNL